MKLKINLPYKRHVALLRFRFDLFLYGHILNPLWNNRSKKRFNRLMARNRAVRTYLKQYKDEIASLTPPDPTQDKCEPSRAFSIWLQGESNAPRSIQACFESMRKNLEQELVVLDEKSLNNWISLPAHIMEKWKAGKIGAAHFSDICRVELLFQHGGLWLDATDYVTNAVPEEIMACDFFVFMAGHKISYWYSYIQNCFIRAKKGNPLIGLWREAIFEYWKHEDKPINYFLHQILFQVLVENNKISTALFARMPKIDQDPTHTLWHQYKNTPYDKVLFQDLTSRSFFHKISYKDKEAQHPLPGTIAAHIFSY